MAELLKRALEHFLHRQRLPTGGRIGEHDGGAIPRTAASRKVPPEAPRIGVWRLDISWGRRIFPLGHFSFVVVSRTKAIQRSSTLVSISRIAKAMPFQVLEFRLAKNRLKQMNEPTRQNDRFHDVPINLRECFVGRAGPKQFSWGALKKKKNFLRSFEILGRIFKHFRRPDVKYK